jgi:HPt (histidine-containing phosphotransfer) domain-containing protein
MKGDREACLKAGMDDYVAKPLKKEELFATIGKVIASRPETVKVEKGLSRLQEEVFDREQLLASVEGDGELLQDIIDLFLAETPKKLAKIQNAITEKDAGRLQRAAHELKGSVSNFGAPTAVDLALELEGLGKGFKFVGALDVFNILVEEMERLKLALENYAGGPNYENPDSRR